MEGGLTQLGKIFDLLRIKILQSRLQDHLKCFWPHHSKILRFQYLLEYCFCCFIFLFSFSVEAGETFFWTFSFSLKYSKVYLMIQLGSCISSLVFFCWPSRCELRSFLHLWVSWYSHHVSVLHLAPHKQECPHLSLLSLSFWRGWFPKSLNYSFFVQFADVVHCDSCDQIIYDDWNE